MQLGKTHVWPRVDDLIVNAAQLDHRLIVNPSSSARIPTVVRAYHWQNFVDILSVGLLRRRRCLLSVTCLSLRVPRPVRAIERQLVIHGVKPTSNYVLSGSLGRLEVWKKKIRGPSLAPASTNLAEPLVTLVDVALPYRGILNR